MQLKDPPPTMKEAPPADVQQQQHEAQEVNQAASASASTSAGTNAGTGTTPTTMPTYFSSATSETYALAKQLLNAGNFEEALSLIEQGLENTKTELRVRLSLTTANANAGDGNNDEELERSIEFNGSVAPFHYLYGTTLLYSLEEAKEDGQDNGGMTVEANSSSNSASASAAAAENNNTPMAQMLSSLSSDAQGGGGAEQQQQQPDVDFAEDIQIAWENLDLARNIIQKMIGEGNVLSETDVAKLQLDLAQIYLREGDLERINGNYSPSIEDYTSCLEILLQHNNTKDENNNERNLDRKIADTQFNLGLTYLTSSSDLQKQLAGDDGNGNDPASAGAAATTPNNNVNAAVLAKEHCEKGIQQHVECAKTFCRILATLFGVEPETILSKARQQVVSEKSDTTTASASAPAGFKTTGLYDDDFKSGTAAAIASQTLNALRMAVATMVSSHPPSDTESTDYVVSDIQQMLDEIQETVDESERSQEGVFQAAQIRVNAQKQAAALSDASSGGGAAFASVTNEDTGVTTSIGFGPASTSSISINDANADTKIAAAKPMMVVKKKKKRKDVGGDGENSKPNDTDDDAKRAKIA